MSSDEDLMFSNKLSEFVVYDKYDLNNVVPAPTKNRVVPIIYLDDDGNERVIGEAELLIVDDSKGAKLKIRAVDLERLFHDAMSSDDMHSLATSIEELDEKLAASRTLEAPIKFPPRADPLGK